ncbi:MAG: protein kinase, partial [Lentisphaeria bacterium]|nr:protein kinase [Lentisphaeria bacterium]
MTFGAQSATLICPVCNEVMAEQADSSSGRVTCPRCHSSVPRGSALVCAQRPLAAAEGVRDSFPGYEVLGRIACGGMGMVLKGRDPRLKRLVAIKVPLASRLVGDQDRERFLREARAAAGLRHPNICSIHEVGEHGGQPHIIMDFIAGCTLREWSKRDTPTPHRVAEMVETLSRAVAYAHAHGVIHRDIKPANVMVDAETGQPVLMDFGLAKETSRDGVQMTQDGQIIGTPAYMAPEQAAGQVADVGPQTDVYALGALLYDLLCGRPPFLGSSGEIIRRVQTEEPVPLRQRNPQVHRDLETICMKCLAREIRERYASAADLAEDLRRFIAGEGILARRSSLPERLWRRTRRNPVTAVAVAAAVLGLAVAATVGAHVLEARRVAGLTLALQTCMADERWQPSHFARGDDILAQLERLQPGQAVTLRKRFHVAAIRQIEQRIQGPRLDLAGATEIEALIAEIAHRDPAAGPPLRHALGQRRSTWQTVFDLTAPYAELPSVFAAHLVGVQKGALLRTTGAGTEPDGSLLCSKGAAGPVQIEATFGREWSAAQELGLALNAVERQSYRFILSSRRGRSVSAPTSATDPSPPAFIELVTPVETAWARISRGDAILLEHALDVSPLAHADLVLRAAREGDRLTFRVGGLPPLVFHDAFPLAAGQAGAFGVLWPEGIPLARLRAEMRPLPPTPSALEQGDQLFTQGRYEDALDFYRAQELGSSATDLVPEVRLKQALCLKATGKAEEAMPVLEQIASEPGQRWPLIAACQLWLTYLEQGRFAEANVLFDGVSSRYGFREVVLQVPHGLQETIVQIYAQRSGRLRAFAHDPHRVADAERAVRIVEFFDQPPQSQSYIVWRYVRALQGAGRLEPAIRVAEDALARFAGQPLVETGIEYCWLLRQTGRHTDALTWINRRLDELQEGPWRHTPSLLPGLLLERARILVAREQWDAALEDITRAEHILDSLCGTPFSDYYYWSEAALMHGFLCEHQGSAESAVAAWRRGLYADWLSRQSTPRDGDPPPALPPQEAAPP